MKTSEKILAIVNLMNDLVDEYADDNNVLDNGYPFEFSLDEMSSMCFDWSEKVHEKEKEKEEEESSKLNKLKAQLKETSDTIDQLKDLHAKSLINDKFYYDTLGVWLSIYEKHEEEYMREYYGNDLGENEDE